MDAARSDSTDRFIWIRTYQRPVLSDQTAQYGAYPLVNVQAMAAPPYGSLSDRRAGAAGGRLVCSDRYACSQLNSPDEIDAALLDKYPRSVTHAIFL